MLSGLLSSILIMHVIDLWISFLHISNLKHVKMIVLDIVYDQFKILIQSYGQFSIWPREGFNIVILGGKFDRRRYLLDSYHLHSSFPSIMTVLWPSYGHIPNLHDDDNHEWNVWRRCVQIWFPYTEISARDLVKM